MKFAVDNHSPLKMRHTSNASDTQKTRCNKYHDGCNVKITMKLPSIHNSDQFLTGGPVSTLYQTYLKPMTGFPWNHSSSYSANILATTGKTLWMAKSSVCCFSTSNMYSLLGIVKMSPMYSWYFGLLVLMPFFLSSIILTQVKKNK